MQDPGEEVDAHAGHDFWKSEILSLPRNVRFSAAFLKLFVFLLLLLKDMIVLKTGEVENI